MSAEGSLKAKRVSKGLAPQHEGTVPIRGVRRLLMQETGRLVCVQCQTLCGCGLGRGPSGSLLKRAAEGRSHSKRLRLETSRMGLRLKFTAAKANTVSPRAAEGHLTYPGWWQEICGTQRKNKNWWSH